MKKLLLLVSIFYFLLLNFEFATAQVPSYVPTNGLVAYYPFNGNANDASGNGNNGVVVGPSLTFDRFGNPNNAYRFSNGVDYMYTNNSYTATNVLTYSIWIKSNATNGGFAINFNNGQVQHGGMWCKTLIIDTNTVTFFTYQGANTRNTASVKILDNLWHNCIVTMDINGSKIYIDGNLKSSNSLQNSGQIYSGFYRFGGLCPNGLNNSLNGTYDDIAIYNRALTQSEITGLYNSGTNTCLPSYLPTTGLVGYWPFCGNANDASGNGNNGTVNGATLTADRFGDVGKAYSFDGVSNYIVVPNSTSFNNTTWSISAWVNPNGYYNGVEKANFMVSKGSDLNNGNYNLHFRSITKKARASIGLGTSTTQYVDNLSDINLNQWKYLTATWDGANLRIYTNGVLENTTSISSNVQGINNENLFFGTMAANSSFTYWLNGKLDDIAIYNRALTATEVQNLYNSSAPASCTASINQNDTTICSGATLILGTTNNREQNINVMYMPTSTTSVSDSTRWHYVAMTKNGLTGSFYLDGNLINTSNFVDNPYIWNSLLLGATQACVSCTPIPNFTGRLDELRISDRVRTSAEISNYFSSNTTFSQDANTIELFHFDTNFQNSIRNEVDGTTGILYGGSSYVQGKFGLGIQFNGIDGYARYSRSIPVDNMTIEFWYKSADTSATLTMLEYAYNNGISLGAQQSSNTYLWSTGATTPSITVNPTATTSYIATVSNGINTCKDTVKITVANITSLAPTTIFGDVDVCASIGLDTASVPVNYKINKIANAASYVWTVPAGATLLSGQGDTSIMVRFSASFVSGAITVKSVRTCNISSAVKSVTVYKRVAAVPTAIQKEFTPTSIIATTNVSGLVSGVYRIKKVAYATSYNWYLNRGTNATITHINASGVNDTAVIVTFASCFVKDTLSVKSVTPCSISTAKTVIMSSSTTPATVAGITTVGGDFAVCIGTSKTFTAIASTPSSTQVGIARYRWTNPLNTVITLASSDSSSITVSFNTGFTGGSLTCKGISACGVVGTTATAAILQFLPPTPLSIGSSTNSYNACINSSVTYTALVGTATTAQAQASVFRWTKPNNTSITSASADSSSITVRFNTGYTGGVISVKGQTRCGTQSAARSQALTHTGCALGTKITLPITTTNTASFEVSLYPNPTTNEFKLLIKNNAVVGSNKPSKAIVKVIDAQGRMMKSFTTNTNQVTAIGNELKSGVYMVEVRLGEEVKVVRAVKF